MTESTTSNMDNVQQKHEEIGTCFCKDCHHSRMERIQKERKQLQVNRLILQNTNYGHIHYVHHVTMERTYELSIQPVTAIKVKTNEHELQPTTIDVAKSQDIEDNNVQVNMQTEVKIFKEHMDTVNELITNREAVDVAKRQDINEVKLVNTTTPWDSQEMLTCSNQKPCRNDTKLLQMEKDIKNKTIYITIEPQPEEMELTHYGHETIEEIPVRMQEDKCKLNVEEYWLKEETEDCDDSKCSDTESVKSLETMIYSENESGFFGSISDLSGITELPNDCEDQKYKLLQDELDRWRNKELKNDKLEIENEWYDTGNIYQEISLLKQSFYNKLSRTQKYITHLKRENEKQIIQYETDVQCLHYEYQKLEEDYEMLNQEHNNCVNWDDYFDVVQQEYEGKINELEKDLALEKTKNENLQQRIGCP